MWAEYKDIRIVMDFVGHFLKTEVDRLWPILAIGGGVVADSNPTAEYEESCNKARALMRAAEIAQRFVS